MCDKIFTKIPYEDDKQVPNKIPDEAPKQIPNNLDILNIIYLYQEKRESIKACPHCESVIFIKYGTYKGLQRFKCKNQKCGCTFSVTTKSLWSYSKKSSTLWMKYLKLMSDGKSIRYCADALKIDPTTAFYWRHKILSAKTLFVEPRKLKCSIEMFTVRFKQSFKGTRNIPSELINNRQTIWITSAIDTNDNLLSRPICEGYFKYDFVEKSLFSKMDKKAFINAYADTNLLYLARKHNKKLPKSTSDNSLVIKQFSLNIKRWLKIFKGIASKYLYSYLSWYITIFKNSHEDIMKLMKSLILQNTFKSNKEFIKTELCTR